MTGPLHAPLVVPFDAGGLVTITGAELAAFTGLPVASLAPSVLSLPQVGELAGAVVLSEAHASAEVSGRSWPAVTRLYSWNVLALWLPVGDTARIHAVQRRRPTEQSTARLTLWPMVRTM